jgi:hypothetical protein
MRHPAYRVELAVDHLVAPGLVELVKGAGKLADAGQVEVIDYGFGHVTLCPPGGSGQASYLILSPKFMKCSLLGTGFFLGPRWATLPGDETGKTCRVRHRLIAYSHLKPRAVRRICQSLPFLFAPIVWQAQNSCY